MVKKSEKITNGLYAYGLLYKSEYANLWEKSKGIKFEDYRSEWENRVIVRNPGSIPLNINVEVTTRCNLACTFCSNPSLQSNQIGDMEITVFEKILEESLLKGGICAVNLNGLGEPLLRNDLENFISVAKSKGVIDVMFHTNGTLLNKRNIQKILDSKIDRIIISVDSPDKNTYESMRLIKGSWDSTNNNYRINKKGSPHSLLINNVRNLIEKIKLRPSTEKPILRVTTVLTDKTFYQIGDFVNFWINEGADLITYQDLTWSGKIDENDSSVNQWKTSSESILKDEYENLRQIAKDNPKNFVCPPLYQSAWIDWDGTVTPCSNPNARVHMQMGNVTENRLDEIWVGSRYNELRAIHEKGQWVDHKICGNCEVPLIEIRKKMNQKSVVSDDVKVLEL